MGTSTGVAHIGATTTIRTVAVDRQRLGEVVSAARRRLDLTQTQLADEAGTDQGQVSNIERAKQAATLETLEKLAPALGMSLRELLARAGIIESGVPVREAIAADSALKPHQREIVLGVYDELSGGR